jgi:predicted dinucleotide-binding enzyme
MNYSIIGSGNVGTALARQFARSNIPVAIANTRGPGSLTAHATELGGNITAKTIEDALKADVIILAVPFRAHPSVAAQKPDWTGKIIIDAMNTYGIEPQELKGMASSEIVAAAFPGAKVVKTFNQLPAKLLAMNPSENGGHRVMFVSGNDAEAVALVAKLVGDLGFAPINLGRIIDSGALLEKGGALILHNLIKQD